MAPSSEPPLPMDPSGARATQAVASYEPPRRHQVDVPGGFATWVAVGLGVHAGAFAWAFLLALFGQMRALVTEMRGTTREYFNSTYEVELEQEKKAEPPKPEEPPPEPEAAPDPEPVAIKAPSDAKDPYEEPPPAAGQAAQILAANDEPVDLTGEGFVQGTSTVGSFYGQVAAKGTGSATYDPNARVGGVPGGKGSAQKPTAPPPPPPGPDKSRPASIPGGSWSNCPFPPEADAEQIDEAMASVVVTVRPDGTPLSVRVVSDPGHGFGRQARTCALGKRYTPGLDRDGNPTTSTTIPINVRFSR